MVYIFVSVDTGQYSTEGIMGAFLVTDNRVFKRPLGRSLIAMFIHSRRSLRSLAPQHSTLLRWLRSLAMFIRSLTHFVHSLEGQWKSIWICVVTL